MAGSAFLISIPTRATPSPRTLRVNQSLLRFCACIQTPPSNPHAGFFERPEYDLFLVYLHFEFVSDSTNRRAGVVVEVGRQVLSIHSPGTGAFPRYSDARSSSMSPRSREPRNETNGRCRSRGKWEIQGRTRSVAGHARPRRGRRLMRLSVDTNTFVYAQNRNSDVHESARTFLESIAARTDVVIAEQALVELYFLI